MNLSVTSTHKAPASYPEPAPQQGEDSLILSRGAALLTHHGPFSEYANHIAERMAEANPEFSKGYVRRLIRAWADVATLRTTGEPFRVTVDMDEVTVAALTLPRTYLSYISTLYGVAWVGLSEPEHYETPGDLTRTRRALISAGYGADTDVWGPA